MGKKLVIVESPAKAKTINKILGRDYDVTSSVGHIRDLPERSIGVDIENDFQPKYVVSKGKKKVIDELKKRAKACDEIFLAPDPDREGEAIAWHVKEVLEPVCKEKPFHRVQYNEITAPAVRRAFEHPGKIDMDRVDAQQARRILDRLVGYTVSPMLWRRVQRGLSAGRVQSVALRLVCAREDKIEKFVPEAYWLMGANVRKKSVPLDPFEIRLSRIREDKAEIKSEEQATAILADLEGRTLEVSEIGTKTIRRKAPPPFITSSLQQAGSTYCSFSPKRTMALAQRLYEGIDTGDGPTGLITYMRTDSFSISKEAQESCRKVISKDFGDDYVPEKPNVYRSRSGAQEAHEAIRPTDVSRTPDSLRGKIDSPDLKLYTLIWERFVASQMSQAKLSQRTVKVRALPVGDRKTEYLFTASTTDVVFPGYMKVAKITVKKTSEKKDGEEKEQKLPPLAEGEPLEHLEWLSERKETKPPPRFSEASLVRELESNGVGRPSTYAQIISTLQQREYVSNEKRSLVPTELGRRVNALLVETLGMLFDVTFTASMEETLDQIEQGKCQWTDMIRGFYGDFEKWMEGTKLPPANGDHVNQSLELLGSVQTWAPAVKRGKRTYSDDRYVASMQKQIAEGKREPSQRQLETLVKMAWRYRDQIPDAEKTLKDMGFSELLASPEMQPPREETTKKLAILLALEMDEQARAFVESLDGRVKSGRRLTDAQLAALDNVIMAHSSQIDNFEAVREEFGLTAQVQDDGASEALLKVMSAVKEWKPPVQRGKRTFDDKQFYESLSKHFQTRKMLSPRQLAALKRMVQRYRDQVPNYERLVERWDLVTKKKKAE